ncbi:MAG: hypothetical protein ACYDBT_09600 [Desulfobulbaceae bacterium]
MPEGLPAFSGRWFFKYRGRNRARRKFTSGYAEEFLIFLTVATAELNAAALPRLRQFLPVIMLF